jgi:hypothetical protein
MARNAQLNLRSKILTYRPRHSLSHLRRLLKAARRPAVAPEAPRLDPATRFLWRVFARKKPLTSDQGLALRSAAQRDELERSRP